MEDEDETLDCDEEEGIALSMEKSVIRFRLPLDSVFEIVEVFTVKLSNVLSHCGKGVEVDNNGCAISLSCASSFACNVFSLSAAAFSDSVISSS